MIAHLVEKHECLIKSLLAYDTVSVFTVKCSCGWSAKKPHIEILGVNTTWVTTLPGDALEHWMTQHYINVAPIKVRYI